MKQIKLKTGALGMMAISKTPCKGKSFMFCLEF